MQSIIYSFLFLVGGNQVISSNALSHGVAWGNQAAGGNASGVDLSSITDISCGGFACVALKTDGSAVAWGDDRYGGNASDVTLTNVTDISCGRYVCVALKIDGTAEAWGDDNLGGNADNVDLTSVKKISCGDGACVALKTDGTAVAWGDDRYGGYTNDVNLTSVVDISCGGDACVALKTDGTAEAWGDDNFGGNADSVDLTNVIDISCGGVACVALKADGTAETWGYFFGGNADSVNLTNVTDISCGGPTCVALKTDGTAEAWGYSDDADSVNNLTNVTNISCGGVACVALKTDGTAEVWGDFPLGGDPNPNPNSNVDLTNIMDISCGGSACVALKKDGTAEAWGTLNGDGGIFINDLTSVEDISCGTYACVARITTLTLAPSSPPTSTPTLAPTMAPTSNPSSHPTTIPTADPTSIPTSEHTHNPSQIATLLPTATLPRKFEWFITPLENETLVGQEALVMSYNISNRQYNFDVFREDCVTEVDGVLEKSLTTSSLGGGFSNVTASLAINQQEIEDNSDVWTSSINGGQIKFCVVMSLLMKDGDENVVVNFLDTVYTITVDQTTGFTENDIATERIAARDSRTEEIDYEVDIIVFQCNDDYTAKLPLSALSQGGILQVCIQVENSESKFELDYVRDMNITQADNEDSPVTVVSNRTNFAYDELTLTECSGGDNQVCMVKFQLIGSFFQESAPPKLSVSGVVKLKLKTSRRRILDELSTAGVNVREIDVLGPRNLDEMTDLNTFTLDIELSNEVDYSASFNKRVVVLSHIIFALLGGIYAL